MLVSSKVIEWEMVYEWELNKGNIGVAPCEFYVCVLCVCMYVFPYMHIRKSYI